MRRGRSSTSPVPCSVWRSRLGRRSGFDEPLLLGLDPFVGRGPRSHGSCRGWTPGARHRTVIPVNVPDLTARELALVTECVSSGWISSSGPFIERFEQSWAAYCGRRHGVAVSSGTAALQVAARCLDLEPGDEVIMPSFTIVSCPLAVI